jgi:hypothetical protein
MFSEDKITRQGQILIGRLGQFLEKSFPNIFKASISTQYPVRRPGIITLSGSDNRILLKKDF